MPAGVYLSEAVLPRLQADGLFTPGHATRGGGCALRELLDPESFRQDFGTSLRTPNKLSGGGVVASR